MGASPDWNNELIRTNRLIWSIVGAMAVIFAAASWKTGIRPDFYSARAASLAIACCLAISWFYRWFRPDPWIALGAQTIAQLAIILTLGVLLSYVAAAPAFPYRDSAFHAIDQWLGLDSIAYLRFFNERPLVYRVTALAYASIRLQTVLVVGALIAASEFERLQRYVIAVAVALAITLTVFVFLPAGNIYTGLNISPEDFPNLSFSGVFDHVAPLAAARGGATFVIDFNALAGLISFSSFHTASAIMFSWAVLPLRKLRWFVLALNVLMVAATPVDGGHYFIDLVGGAIAACVAILCAGLMQRSIACAEMRCRSYDAQVAMETDRS